MKDQRKKTGDAVNTGDTETFNHRVPASLVHHRSFLILHPLLKVDSLGRKADIHFNLPYPDHHGFLFNWRGSP